MRSREKRCFRRIAKERSPYHLKKVFTEKFSVKTGRKQFKNSKQKPRFCRESVCLETFKLKVLLSIGKAPIMIIQLTIMNGLSFIAVGLETFESTVCELNRGFTDSTLEPQSRLWHPKLASYSSCRQFTKLCLVDSLAEPFNWKVSRRNPSGGSLLGKAFWRIEPHRGSKFYRRRDRK